MREKQKQNKIIKISIKICNKKPKHGLGGPSGYIFTLANKIILINSDKFFFMKTGNRTNL